MIRGQCLRISVFKLRICRCPRSRFNHARMKRTKMTEMTACLQIAQEYRGRRVQTSGKEGHRVAAQKTVTEACHPTTTPVPPGSIARRPVCWASRASTPGKLTGFIRNRHGLGPHGGHLAVESKMKIWVMFSGSVAGPARGIPDLGTSCPSRLLSQEPHPPILVLKNAGVQIERRDNLALHHP